MTQRIADLLKAVPRANEQATPLFEQLSDIYALADHFGLLAAHEFIVSAHGEIVSRTGESRSQQAVLFRLKQIDAQLESDLTHTLDKVRLKAEKAAIFREVQKPVGIPIQQFAAESAEGTLLIQQLIEDIASGKAVLS